ncbi:hypothetical protein A9Q84_03700 [Halobacteriovorax marinus]|uniref:Radical SAM core domain-containing protein n=1 Tax=Halobacteriovorax marinus TaxID=97084 RepID=A0A1Y5FAF8_9BACT|nr:hypothetical protein A9Q84_03700 [Halobacteriovorax marinus]
MKELSWQEEYRSAIRSHKELENYFNHTFSKTPFPILIPLGLAQKIKRSGINSVLGKQFLPVENENCHKGFIDPIGDHDYSPVAGLVHRYKNRVLFFPTSNCPVICRYCFRKNELSTNDDLFKSNFKKVKEYLLQHSEVEEIIFSGGDPFILSDEKIQYYLEEFKEIKSIKYIRFHTRTPVIIPTRFTNKLISLLKTFKSVFVQLQIVVHINHSDEIDLDVKHTLEKLDQAGITLLSQSVLLKGVNNDFSSLKDLIDALVSLNIRPYYLHHPDQVRGASHFNITLSEGRAVYAKLRDALPGWAIPTYIIDLPSGEGKTSAFNPESYNFSGQFINKDGTIIPHKEPI